MKVVQQPHGPVPSQRRPFVLEPHLSVLDARTGLGHEESYECVLDFAQEERKVGIPPGSRIVDVLAREGGVDPRRGGKVRDVHADG